MCQQDEYHRLIPRIPPFLFFYYPWGQLKSDMVPKLQYYNRPCRQKIFGEQATWPPQWILISTWPPLTNGWPPVVGGGGGGWGGHKNILLGWWLFQRGCTRCGICNLVWWYFGLTLNALATEYNTIFPPRSKGKACSAIHSEEGKGALAEKAGSWSL